MAAGSRSSLRPPVALTIAASDSGGGAGIQADLATFQAHGVFGVTVLTAVTAQNSRGVVAVEPISPELVGAQMDAVFPDFRPGAVKIGMLFDAARVRAVAERLRFHLGRSRPRAPVVLDPVLASKDGTPLLSGRAVGLLRRELLPLCDLVTPNLPEAAILAGVSVADEAGRRRAARILADSGARAVLIKGGHGRGNTVRDLLYDGRGARFRELSHPRISTRARHGTGCVLSSAIAANLALGRGLDEAVDRAVAYLQAALARGIYPGRGWGTPGRLPAATTRIRAPGRARDKR